MNMTPQLAQESQINYYALALCILKEGWTPERSIAYLSGANNSLKTITEQDVQDMIAMKSTMTYTEIGQLYGLNRCAVYNRIRRFEKRI